MLRGCHGVIENAGILSKRVGNEERQVLCLASPRCMNISCFRRRCMNFEAGKMKEVLVKKVVTKAG